VKKNEKKKKRLVPEYREGAQEEKGRNHLKWGGREKSNAHSEKRRTLTLPEKKRGGNYRQRDYERKKTGGRRVA